MKGRAQDAGRKAKMIKDKNYIRKIPKHKKS